MAETNKLSTSSENNTDTNTDRNSNSNSNGGISATATEQPSAASSYNSSLATDAAIHTTNTATSSSSSSISSASASSSSSPASALLSFNTPLGNKRASTDPFENSVWKRFLLEDEKIVFTGLVKKASKSLFSLEHKRQLILTSLPRFVYVDPEAMTYKKDIAWDDIQTAVIDDRAFKIQTPHRTYIMKGLSTGARVWVEEIEKMNKIVKAEEARQMALLKAMQPQYQDMHRQPQR